MMVQGYGVVMMDHSHFSLTICEKVAARKEKAEKWGFCMGQFGFFGFEGRQKFLGLGLSKV